MAMLKPICGLLNRAKLPDCSSNMEDECEHIHRVEDCRVKDMEYRPTLARLAGPTTLPSSVNGHCWLEAS
eukprot:10555257-Karenia_brevis.AAC.1